MWRLGVIACIALLLVCVFSVSPIFAQVVTPTPTATSVVLVTATPVLSPTPTIDEVVRSQLVETESVNQRVLFFGVLLVGVLALLFVRSY
jgi:hypothetical protein